MYPTPKQTSILIRTLLVCKDLYNKALEQRISLYRNERKSISYVKQAYYFSQNKNDDEKEIHSQVAQNVLKRLDNAYQRFFKLNTFFYLRFCNWRFQSSPTTCSKRITKFL